ncbi:MAG: hypothetical protein PSY14_03350 [bacterium]|nr:hypothetical protein [bacterium]
MSEAPPDYDIVISEKTLSNILSYKKDLEDGKVTAGDRLRRYLPAASTEQFIEALLATKQPRIFAESEIRADGADWTHRELALLGDINVTMAVDVFDNGTWNTHDKHFSLHNPPLKADLLFTPGPLLGVGAAFNGVPPDFVEATTNGRIDQSKYDALMERRLLPLLVHANDAAGKAGHKALVVLPGIGAGAFAGAFKGTMGVHLDLALRHMLAKHGAKLPHIGAVVLDTFNEGTDARDNISGVDYRTRPSALNAGRPQLSGPVTWQENGDDFANYKLYKIVAWDHASLPGNDFFGASRFTDDGVAAAATNSMLVVTGISGHYTKGAYNPPAGYADWEDAALQNNVKLRANGNVKIAMDDGSYQPLTHRQPPRQPRAPAP